MKENIILSLTEIKWLNSTKHYKGGYEFFIKWKKLNKTSPTHLVVFEYLNEHTFNWGNLKDKAIEIQPHFLLNEVNKLYEMDMSIVGIAMSQLAMESKIHQYIVEMAKNAISRQLNERVKNRVTVIRYVNWHETLLKLKKILEEQANVELPNTNSEYFYRYFNEEE